MTRKEEGEELEEEKEEETNDEWENRDRYIGKCYREVYQAEHSIK